MICVRTSRFVAFSLIKEIVYNGKTLDGLFERTEAYQQLQQADKQFVRLLVLTVLRRFGQLEQLLALFLQKPLPSKRQDVRLVLLMGIAQLFFLKTPPHAAVHTSVELIRQLKQSSFANVVNGVLRSFERKMAELSEPSATHNIPTWLLHSWEKAYGKQTAQKIAEAVLAEPALEITVRDHPEYWAQKWQGVVLPTGTVRCSFFGNVTELEGFEEGLWWVQEASASVPAQLFKDVTGQRVADLCAAPGGKTAQLAARGAKVDAFDISQKRCERLRENMKRLKLDESVRVICQNALDIQGAERYDAVLLDAPCSATGTVRKHPDLFFHREQADVLRLAALQKELFLKAVQLLKPNGYLVYSTCSLQPEENEDLIAEMLERCPQMERGVLSDKWRPYQNKNGAICILPDLMQDGFFAVLLHKKNT